MHVVPNHFAVHLWFVEPTRSILGGVTIHGANGDVNARLSRDQIIETKGDTGQKRVRKLCLSKAECLRSTMTFRGECRLFVTLHSTETRFSFSCESMVIGVTSCEPMVIGVISW